MGVLVAVVVLFYFIYLILYPFLWACVQSCILRGSGTSEEGERDGPSACWYVNGQMDGR